MHSFFSRLDSSFEVLVLFDGGVELDGSFPVAQELGVHLRLIEVRRPKRRSAVSSPS